MNKDIIVVVLEIITIVTREIKDWMCKGKNKIPRHKSLTF